MYIPVHVDTCTEITCRWVICKADQLLYSVDLLPVREGAGAVVPEEIEEVGWFGDVQTHIIPVVKVL